MRMVAENSHRRIPGRGEIRWLHGARGRVRTPHSGGPGTRPGGITTALQGSLLDWDWRVASSQEARTRGQKSP